MQLRNVNSNILTVILRLKTACKDRRFSAENDPTLDALCDKTIDHRSLKNDPAENRRFQVSKNTWHFCLVQKVSEINAFL